MTVEVRWHNRYEASGLLRELAIEVTGTDPGTLHHWCPTCGAITHGRPGFDADLWVSVARSDPLTVVALSLHGPVGVDVTEGTDELALDWVRTEAVAKARGTGLRVAHDLDRPDLWISQVTLPEPFVGAVAGVKVGLSRSPAVRAAARRTATR